MTTAHATGYSNEADVEVKFAYPLLSEPHLLAIPPEAIKPKSYLAPTALDKQAGKTSGYFPDYSIWFSGYPVLVVEVKDPKVAAEVGFREACLYARHLNARYATGINPCRYVVATNGVRLLAGVWDQEQPIVDEAAADLLPGSVALESLVGLLGVTELSDQAARVAQSFATGRGLRPFNFAGGQAILAGKRPLNSFAADLSPILRRYFSSKGEEDVHEIVERAYVSSAEVTEYDKVLEALLKDRGTPRRDTIVKTLSPGKHDEDLLTGTLQKYDAGDRGGQLQIIQGGVGSGKSLFARRYRQVLEPEESKASRYWAFINFNGSPPSLAGAEVWLAESFLEAISRDNPGLDIYEGQTLRGIFSRRIQQRRSYYEQMALISAADEIRARAEDIAKWQEDPVEYAQGVSQYLVGSLSKTLIVVMDNVDKLDLQNQLDAFQLTLWFMEKSKAFIILQMRDETYERFKNRPPLDTYRSGIAFHISPPRFIDVVKRRLELGIEYLGEHAPDQQEYVLDNGARVVLPKGELGRFLTALYGALFGRRNTVSRLLEALAGRDVRHALEMFVSLVTSGHLSTSAITSAARGGGEVRIQEHTIIKILMRTDYNFFSQASGFVANIFHYENEWKKPNNFVCIEALYYLSINRKRTGELGLQGYFAVSTISGHLERMGYDPNDVVRALNYLIQTGLIVADNFRTTELSADQSVKILASGFMHLRVLCERIEYLYGVIPVMPISDNAAAHELARFVDIEVQKKDVSAYHKARAVQALYDFLAAEFERLKLQNPFFEEGSTGGEYVLNAIKRSLDRFWDRSAPLPDDTQLDLL